MMATKDALALEKEDGVDIKEVEKCRQRPQHHKKQPPPTKRGWTHHEAVGLSSQLCITRL